MIVKILRFIPGWAYFGGEITEIPDERAAELVARGQAVMIPEVVQDINVVQTVIREEETVKKRIKKA